MKPPFPHRAVLVREPGSEFARENMTVGKEYIVHEQAGCCVIVDTNIPGQTTIINPCWLEKVL